MAGRIARIISPILAHSALILVAQAASFDRHFARAGSRRPPTSNGADLDGIGGVR